MAAARTRRSTPTLPTLAVLVALILGSLASPLVAAQDGTSSANETTAPKPGDGSTNAVHVVSDRTRYAAGELVRLELVNGGDARLEGAFLFRFFLDCERSNSRCGDQPRDATGRILVTTRTLGGDLPPGKSLALDWRQTDGNGKLVPRGTYELDVVYENRTARAVIQGPTLVLDPPETQTPGAPVLFLHAPHDGEKVRSPVTVHFQAGDDVALTRVHVRINDVLVSARDGIHEARYEYRTDHQLRPGNHTLTIVLVDTDGNEVVKRSSFTVGAPSDEKRLALSTDRDAYGTHDPITFTLENTGTAALDGTLQLVVSTRRGAVVWSPSAAQVIETLEPGDHKRVSWDARNDDGRAIAPGMYVATASFAGIHARTEFTVHGTTFDNDLRIQLRAPASGSSVRDELTVVAVIGEPGATHVTLELVNGQRAFDVAKRFDKPHVGEVRHTFDLEGVLPGTYDLVLRASGPGGNGTAHAQVRIVSGIDTSAPALELVFPRPDHLLPRSFPVVFRADDDVGIQYAEAYLDGQLVARKSWPAPVDHGALPVHLPMATRGQHVLKLVVYDEGNNEAQQTLNVRIDGPSRPCLSVALEASQAMHASARDGPGNHTPVPVSNEALIECLDRVPEDQREKVLHGLYRYAQTQRGWSEVELRGKLLFDDVTRPGADEADPSSLRLRTEGRFLVTRTTAAGEVQYDLNGSWLATQRGSHVLLENTDDGSKVLLVLVGGSPQVLGNRIVADMPANGRVIARPLGPGALEDRVSDAILTGHVGAEVHVADADAGDAVAYAPGMNVTVSVDGQRIAAIVSSEDHRGRTVVFTLDDAVATPGVAGYDVFIDGERIEAAASLEAVLAQLDATGPSLYYVVQDAGETKVIVAFNHFSTREVVIQAAAFVEQFITPLALIGGFAVIGAATLALFRREQV